jgi:hypothetical protein
VHAAAPRALGKLVAQVGEANVRGPLPRQQPTNPVTAGASALGAFQLEHIQLLGRFSEGIGAIGHERNRAGEKSMPFC